MRILVVAEGSGGHLIPALEMSRALTNQQAHVTLLYARRTPTAQLLQQLIHDARMDGVHVWPIRLPSGRRVWRKLWQAGRMWRLAQERLEIWQPHVVVGFGGWLSIPVVLAARQRRIPIVIHEQNVRLGKANRFLVRRHWVDRAALSFEKTGEELNGTPATVTGLPIRRVLGLACREDAARQFKLDPARPTILVLGGSQGSQAVNRIACRMLSRLTDEQQRTWQFIHLTGGSDYAEVQSAYERAGVRAWIAPHLVERAWAYALADVVIARAGASTIAELAHCGTPSILIPYPYASGHQRDNARVVEEAEAGVRLEEAEATPQRLHGLLWQFFANEHLRRTMGERMHVLAQPDATHRLAETVSDVVRTEISVPHA